MTRLTASILCLAVCAALVGCRSDPYCETAIADLRAEKIQLENQYYELKAQYEADMARLGIDYARPSTDLVAPGYSPNAFSDSEAFDREPLRGAGNSNGQAVLGDGSLVGMASQIRSVEVLVLEPIQNGSLTLLVRPLDAQGAILPLQGDIKLRILNPDDNTTLLETEYGADQVAHWVVDRADQQPGIHLPVSLPANTRGATRLVCDLQYRTADNRILKHRMEFSPSTNAVQGPTPALAQPASSVLPDDLGGQIQIEIGDELNFESLDDSKSKSPPSWKPDR